MDATLFVGFVFTTVVVKNSETCGGRQISQKAKFYIMLLEIYKHEIKF